MPNEKAPKSKPLVTYGNKNNDLAVASLVLSLCGFFILPFLGSILGIIFGIVAKKQIKASGELGKGMANAGIIVGVIPILIGLLAAILWLFILIIIGIVAISSAI